MYAARVKISLDQAMMVQELNDIRALIPFDPDGDSDEVRKRIDQLIGVIVHAPSLENKSNYPRPNGRHG